MSNALASPAAPVSVRRGSSGLLTFFLGILVLCLCGFCTQAAVFGLALNPDPPQLVLLDYYEALRLGEFERAHDYLTSDYGSQVPVSQLQQTELQAQATFGAIKLNARGANKHPALEFKAQRYDSATRYTIGYIVNRTTPEQPPLAATLEVVGRSWKIAGIGAAQG